MGRVDDVQAMFARRSRTVRDIQHAVAEHYGVTIEALVGDSRTRGFYGPDICTPRHVAYTLARRHTTASTAGIGRRFNRDHSTIIQMARKIDKKALADAELANDIAAIEATL